MSPAESPNHQADNKRRIMWLSLAGVVAMTVITGLVAWRFSSNAEASTKSAAISIGQKGINPQTVVMSSGDTLVITNYDNQPHNLHADETVLPGFNTLQSLNRDDSHGYTFEKKGTYRLYDPKNPANYNATVVVK